MITKFIKFIIDPEIRFDYFTVLGLHNWMSDERFLRRIWKTKFGKELSLDNPKSFNEKLQWLKLYNRKKIYTTMVDKAEVKKYVADIIGEEYIIPTIGIYDRFDEIDFDSLPKRFVMKCTHDSNGLVIVKDKEIISRKMIKKKINKCLKRNYYYAGREWPYKDVKPRIIIEKYMGNEDAKPIIDYKFFCFSGKPKIILVCSDRFSIDGMKETWFDSDWKLLPIKEGGHEIDSTVEKPKNFKKMKEISSIISKDTAFLRVDFYEIDNKVYFGEITFYPASGYEKFEPEEWNRILGSWLDLDNVSKSK